MILSAAWHGAEWELNIIRALAKLSNGFTDTFFKCVTFFGDEIVFILIAALLYWCYDKRFAYKFMFSYIAAAVSVGVIKNFVSRPRPFATEGINSIGAETHGYSFPSGHSQSIASQGALLSQKFGSRKRWWIYPVAAVIILLVMFSRMFLAQHFLTDVLTGAALGIICALLFGLLFDLMKNREEYFSLILIPIFVTMMIIQGNQEYGALKDLYVAAAGFIGVAIGYIVEKRYIKYDVKKACLWMQAVKFAAGLAVALIIKEGLKAAFPKEKAIFDFIRYLLMAFWAACGAPAVFKYTGIKFNSRRKKDPDKSLNNEKDASEAAVAEEETNQN